MNLGTVITIFSCTILVISKDNFDGSTFEKEYEGSTFLENRFKRDAHALETSIKRMTMIARLTNGIYLQKEFLEGSIPPGEFISELFHFGTVTPSQIESMNVENIDSAFDSLKILPDELQKDKNFDRMKDLFDSIRKILMELDGNIEEWKEKENFIKNIKTLAANGIDFTAVHELRDALKSWSHENEKLTDNPSNLNNHVALGALISLQGYTETMIGAFNRLPLISRNVKFVSIETASEALQPILKASEEIEKLSDEIGKLQKATQVKVDDVKNFSLFSDVAEKLNQIIPHLTNIKAIVISRSIRKRRLKYTHGFSNGAYDILSIFEDLEDPWIQKIVNGSNFSKSLKKLEEFGELATKTEEAMKFLDNPAVFQSIAELLILSTGVLEVSYRSENVGKSLSSVSKCVPIIPRKMNNKILFEFKKEVFQIDNLLNQIRMFLGKLIQFSEESNAVRMLERTLEVVEKATDLSTVADVVSQYNMNLGSKDLENFIKNSSWVIQEFFNPIDKPKKLVELVTAVKSKLGYLNSYHEMLKKYSIFFQCLQNIDKMNSSFKTFSLIKYIRKLKPKDLGFIGDGMKVAKNMTVVSKNLEDLEKSIDQMKNYKSVETDALRIFENASMNSKVIGTATRGILVMKNVIDEPRLELNVSVILEQLNKVYPPLNKEDITNLNGIISLKSELFVMYNSLEEFQDNIQEQNFSKLFDYYELFRKAEKVIGMKGNVTNMIKSIGKLAERVINGSLELITLKEHLEKVEISGIHFSEYSGDFKDSKDTLASLDLFFADYSRIIAESLPNNSKVGFFNASTTLTTFSTTKTPLYLEGYIGWSLFLLVVLVSVAALSYASYVFMCKKKSEKSTKKKKQEDEE